MRDDSLRLSDVTDINWLREFNSLWNSKLILCNSSGNLNFDSAYYRTMYSYR